MITDESKAWTTWVGHTVSTRSGTVIHVLHAWPTRIGDAIEGIDPRGTMIKIHAGDVARVTE